MEGATSWIDSYNSSWTREDIYLILSVGGTQCLYERLAANGELEGGAIAQPRLLARKVGRWKVIDADKRKNVNLMPKRLTVDAGLHLKDEVTNEDVETMISGMLELQIKLGRHILNHSDVARLLHQKVQI